MDRLGWQILEDGGHYRTQVALLEAFAPRPGYRKCLFRMSRLAANGTVLALAAIRELVVPGETWDRWQASANVASPTSDCIGWHLLEDEGEYRTEVAFLERTDKAQGSLGRTKYLLRSSRLSAGKPAMSATVLSLEISAETWSRWTEPDGIPTPVESDGGSSTPLPTP